MSGRATDRTRGVAGRLVSPIAAAMWVAVWVSVWIASLPGCGEPATPEPTGDPTTEKLWIFTVNHPLECFARRIGGDAVDVVFLAPPDVDPALWSPTAEVVLQAQSADLVLLNGAGYAGWVERVTLPATRQVDTSAAYTDRLLAREAAVTHSHGPTGEHSHGSLATTTWLDLELARAQAAAVAEALVRARPERETDLRVRAAELDAELAALDARLRDAAAALAARPVLFSHPVYAYLQRRYGLEGPSLHWEPDQAPMPADWRELDGLLSAGPAPILFWEDTPLRETQAALDERGVRSVVFAPAANRPERGDWLDVMHANAARLEAAADFAEGQSR